MPSSRGTFGSAVLVLLASMGSLCLTTSTTSACEFPYFSPREEWPGFCEDTVAALDFEVTETHVSEEGDSLDGFFTFDPDTGEAQRTAAWTPDLWPYPHVDVSFRVLVAYGGMQLPERMAL